MAHPYWPLFDLEIRTPRLVARYVDDDLGTQLAALAAAGIHDPGFMPFSVPWSQAPSPELERNTLQYYWRCRADTSPASWNLQFAVVVDGEVVGTTGLMTHDFPITRSFETGSWLGRAHQGRGLGTELRVAALHLGFLAFDALLATTGAFDDNAPSLGVTRKLGYTPNGVAHHARTGTLGRIEHFRMDREHFLAHVRRDDIEIAGDEAARDLLGISR
jgi:RimJ/RimL family protein N-acetyltransferase